MAHEKANKTNQQKEKKRKVEVIIKPSLSNSTGNITGRGEIKRNMNGNE